MKSVEEALADRLTFKRAHKKRLEAKLDLVKAEIADIGEQLAELTAEDTEKVEKLKRVGVVKVED